MKRGFRIGKISGIEVDADVSLVVLALLLVASLYVDLRRAAPGSTPESLLGAAAVGGLLFIGSVLAHELSHSLLAERRGLPVRRIRLFIFGGVSEIEREAENPTDEFQVAIAGPVSSAVIGLFFIGVGIVAPDNWVFVTRLGTVLGVVNLLLAAFNLLPGYPLDGGRVLRALLWRRWERERATRFAIAAGRGFALFISGIGAWLLIQRRDISGLWTLGVGWFLFDAAVAAATREKLLARIDGLTLADVMRSVTEAVPGEATVTELVAFHQVGPRLAPVPVVVDGRIRGIVAEENVESIQSDMRSVTSVARIMTPIGPDDVAPAGESLEAFLRRASPSETVLVTIEGRVVGIVTGRELARAIAV